MNKSFYVRVIIITMIALAYANCETHTKKGKFDDSSRQKIDTSRKKDKSEINKVDSIRGEDMFLKVVPTITLPNSFNVQGKEYLLSDFKNGKYKNESLSPLTADYIGELYKLSYKRYIYDAIKKHYSDNVDLMNYLKDKNSKMYGLGKIEFKENGKTSMIIYQEIPNGDTIDKFIIMVNYDTSFGVYLHSALLAIEVNSGSEKITLGSSLSNETENITAINQNYKVNGDEKSIRIEINRAFCYSPPSEGGPNPKDYINYK